MNTDKGIILPNKGSSSIIHESNGVSKSLTSGVITPATPKAMNEVAISLLNIFNGFLLNNLDFIKKI